MVPERLRASQLAASRREQTQPSRAEVAACIDFLEWDANASHRRVQVLPRDFLRARLRAALLRCGWLRVRCARLSLQINSRAQAALVVAVLQDVLCLIHSPSPLWLPSPPQLAWRLGSRPGRSWSFFLADEFLFHFIRFSFGTLAAADCILGCRARAEGQASSGRTTETCRSAADCRAAGCRAGYVAACRTLPAWLRCRRACVSVLAPDLHEMI